MIQWTALRRALAGIDWRPIEHLKVVDHDVYATHEGFLDFGGEPLGVFKLSNGEVVFNAEDVAKLLGMTVEEVAEAAGGHREMVR